MKRPLDQPINVTCYSGYKGEETPRSFIYENKSHEICEIIERWCDKLISGTGLKHFFKVKADNGRLYVIYYDQELDIWFLSLNASS